MKKELKYFTIEEILNELLRREKTSNSFEIKSKTATSCTIKFYKND